ncbi:MAG: ABC transporter permease [Lachnospiraceae bacterium]|jgi:putative ABC transport system permease protein|nr:ABC transporter permease [Lachnospiraceae bacterium]
MSIITEYTIAHIKRNRRTSIAIMIAVLLAGTLICSFSMMAQGIWAGNVNNLIYSNGNWHGELFEDTPANRLATIENNPHVDAAMLLGPWQTVKLPEGTALPYLLLRDADANYWKSMPEQHRLMEGRLPAQPGELALSKLFFDRNPEFKVGDVLTLPVGERTLSGEILETQAIHRLGEYFTPTEEKTFTLVGKLDYSTPTTHPGYVAFGFLDRTTLRPEDHLVIYLRFHDIYKTLGLMPEIAEKAGHVTDEHGEYPIRYNDGLLFCYLANMGQSGESTLLELSVPLMTILTVILVVCTFILIIRGVFALSANVRARQLGIFRSIGATPAQIIQSILQEGLLLSVLPLILSVSLGFAFTQVLAKIFNNVVGELVTIPFSVQFHLPTALFGVLLTLTVVILSARGPAKAIARVSPIEAVRHGGKPSRHRKPKNHPVYRALFGFIGEFAAEAVAARRKSFRSSTGTICVSFILVCGMLCMLTIADQSNRLRQQEEYYDTTAILWFVESRDDQLIELIRNLPFATESIVRSTVNCAMMVDESNASDRFTALGGFAGVDETRIDIVKSGDHYRIGSTVYGLDDESFSRYALSLGIDPTPYLNADTPLAIAQNALRPYPMARDKVTATQVIPYLNLASGDTITLLERFDDHIDSDYTFDLTVGAVTLEVSPEINGGQLIPYEPVFVVPYSQYDKLVANLLPDRAASNRRTDVSLVTGAENSIAAEAALNEICSAAMGSEDFLIYSKEGELRDMRQMNSASNTMNMGIAIMFALIGISNAFSAVTTELYLRQREFAMLRSVGLDNRGLSKLLFVEGLNFSLRPVLLGLPFIALICLFFTWMSNLTFTALLPILPYGSILLYSLLVLLLMGIAYWNGARAIRRAIIIEGLRDETV